MVKISELETDLSIWWAEQLVVNDWWTTKKTTVDAILARTHNHTASQITDFDTEVSNNTTVTTLVSDLDTAEATIVTNTSDITGKLGKTELRTGLTANKALVTDWSGNEWYTDMPILINKLAGESITAGNLLRMNVSIPAGDSISQNTWTTDMASFWVNTGNNAWYWQSFLTTNWWLLTTLSCYIKKNGTPTNNIRCELFDLHTKTLIATSTNVINWASVTTSQASYNFTFNNVPLWSNTRYVFILKIDATYSISNFYYAWWIASNAYANWDAYAFNLTGNLIFFSTANDLRFTITLWAYTSETSWRVYKASPWFEDIVWIAKNTDTVWNQIFIDTNYTSIMSGLTNWKNYYLSFPSGSISQTVSESGKIVWRSISTTELLINLF